MTDEETTGVPHFLDDVELIERKRMRLDSIGRKRWCLTDRASDQEVMEEMGVGLLPQSVSDEVCDVAGSSQPNMFKSDTKRKRDIENVSPNVNGQSPGRARVSPRKPKRSSPNNKDFTKDDSVLTERSMNAPYEAVDEETPLPLLPAGSYHSKRVQPSPGACSSAESNRSGTNAQRLSMVTSRSPCPLHVPSPSSRDEDVCDPKSAAASADLFADVSDEVMLHVFKWLPKRSLVRCTLVCRRWHRIASDESLWTRLELGERVVSRGALGRVLAKQPVVLRLAGAEVGDWSGVRSEPAHRLQYLDLSMCAIDKGTLNCLLSCCPLLRRLSLETVAIDKRTCQIIGECTRLETLNMTMATGSDPEGLAALLDGCPMLQSLNISWCGLTAESARVVSERLPRGLQRLNIAGCRPLTDQMVGAIVSRCPDMQELDLSDCTLLTEASLRRAAELQRLEHLAVSRCYLLAPIDTWQVKKMPALQYLDVWGMLPATALAALRSKLTSVTINQFMLSAIARPTVGPRRTSIWGIRTRD